jgi:hypothetical protein
MLHNYGFGVDGVAQYALYLLNRLYDPESAIEDLECLAAYVITETASPDGKVGGPVQMATVTARDSQVLGIGIVEDILLTNRDRSQALKNSFLKKDSGLGSARTRMVKPTSALETPSETGDSASPLIPPFDGRVATPDALSSFMEDAIGEVSTGTSW